MFLNITEYISALESHAELIRIKEFVNPNLEISEITDRIVKSENNKALLFENNGTDFPILINAFGSEKRVCMALRINSIDDLPSNLEKIFKIISKPQKNIIDKINILKKIKELNSWIPKKSKNRGSCQHIIMPKPDLTKIPVLKCWPFDGGPFITLPVVHTFHPDSKIRNVGMYRMQIFDKVTTGMHWHLHKGAAKHYMAFKEKKMHMPVSVTLGGDPVYTYVATAPLPENIDEYILAGYLRKKNVTLVKCITNDIYVPEDVDFVIEGYIDTQEDLKLEGPFGDHTGFYSLPDFYPVFHVTAITHRKNAIYPATIVGIPPQEDTWLAKATERLFLSPIKLLLLPELIDMSMPSEGVFHNIVFCKIKNEYKGHAFKVLNALWGAGQMMFNKIMFVFNENTDIQNPQNILKQICLSVDPASDILFNKGPLDVLDHSTDIIGFGGKMGVDATKEMDNYKLLNIETQENIFSCLNNFKNSFPEIIDWNKNVISEGYNIIIISINKTNNGLINNIVNAFLKETHFKEIKFYLFVESLINPNDLPNVVWRSANNIDPSRDCNIYTNAFDNKVLVIDATMKSKKNDKFNREWPNIIVSDENTINLVDSKWEKYGIGPFIKSPSLKYRLQKYSGNDTVKL